ncbi:hypothetical protein Ahy_B09g099698 isoform G [Arachis hypogaea]|uniref:Uncharacterized protein n=1 Tax=Arachis hypogaea TaxID=3818 RepID=A0A444XUL7_ARAHY|nr:hypothetical protein Ahy_B09g099698 isoform G [Arachis hypogaea]
MKFRISLVLAAICLLPYIEIIAFRVVMSGEIPLFVNSEKARSVSIRRSLLLFTSTRVFKRTACVSIEPESHPCFQHTLIDVYCLIKGTTPAVSTYQGVEGVPLWHKPRSLHFFEYSRDFGVHSILSKHSQKGVPSNNIGRTLAHLDILKNLHHLGKLPPVTMHLDKSIEGANIRLASCGSHLLENFDCELILPGSLKSRQKGGVGKHIRGNPIVFHGIKKSHDLRPRHAHLAINTENDIVSDQCRSAAIFLLHLVEDIDCIPVPAIAGKSRYQ